MSTPTAHPVFHPVHAAFSGFGMVRQHWRAILVWAALRFLISVVMTALVILLAKDNLDQLAALTHGRALDEADTLGKILGAFSGLQWIALVVWPVSLLQEVVLVTAVYRAYLRPAESRWAYLRLGRAELITAAVSLIWWVLFFGGLFLVSFLAVLVKNTLFLVSPALSVIWSLTAFVAVIALLTYGLTRTSLAWIDSYDRGEISLFHSLRLSRGHAFHMLIAYVISFSVMVGLFIGGLLVFLILGTIAAVASGQGAASVGAAMFQPDRSSLAAYFTLATIIWLLFLSVIASAGYATLFGPSAEAYLTFKAQGDNGRRNQLDAMFTFPPSRWARRGGADA
jgi:hypothetical protein